MPHLAKKTTFLARARGLLLAAPWAIAASLSACGGGDEVVVNPPVPPTNLADCHNPSMYTVGSSWSVAFTTTSTSNAPGAAPPEPQQTLDEMSVTAPPADWELGADIVRTTPYRGSVNDDGYAGTYLRVAGGVVQTLYKIGESSLWNRPATYLVLLPALEAPIALAPGNSFESTASLCPYPRFIEWDGKKQVYPKPTTENCPETPTQFTTNRWTFNGAASVTVPAGTFMTCDISSVQGGTAFREWRVANGPYKGLTVKQVSTSSDSVFTKEANSISVDWK